MQWHVAQTMYHAPSTARHMQISDESFAFSSSSPSFMYGLGVGFKGMETKH